MITRRHFLKTATLGSLKAAALAGSALPPALLAAIRPAQAETDAAPLTPLRIPPLLSGTQQSAFRHYQLQAQHGNTAFFPDRLTPTMGLNGSYLGPTLRMRRGEQVRIQVSNALEEATTLHWHGIDLPASADGGPYQVIQPGESWTASFPIKQQAATCWYHSHMLHTTGRQVYAGLGGLLILDDDHSDSLNLPSEYGVDDIPVVMQDRNFNRDGSFDYPDNMEAHMMGARGFTMLTNGTLNAMFQARTSRIRLRLLNAANARAYTLAFDDGRRFHQIATDLGFMEQPLERQQLVLSPGERAEIIVDTYANAPFKLINVPVESDYPSHFGVLSELMRNLDTQAFDILTIIPPENAVGDSPALPQQLNQIDWMDESQADYHRLIEMQMGEGPGNGGRLGGGPGNRRERGGWGGGNHRINGRMMDINFIEATIPAGSVEIWEVTNDSPMMHPFHIHKVKFQILDRNGQPPGPDERGYKDTVRVPPHGRVRLIARFNGPGDPMTPYMFHCHILEHEDHGMMGQFIIV